MSLARIEQGYEGGPVYAEYMKLLFQRKRNVVQMPIQDSERAEIRWDLVLGVPSIEKLTHNALQQTISGWSRKSQNDIRNYLRGSKDDLQEDTLLEVDVSLRRAMTEQVAERRGGYGTRSMYSAENVATGDDREWRLRAACRDVDPAVFFPEKEDGEAKRGRAKQAAIDVARAICRTCVVSPECREAALDKEERYGIWAGKRMEGEWD